jgi:hypothetical protein
MDCRIAKSLSRYETKEEARKTEKTIFTDEYKGS